MKTYPTILLAMALTVPMSALTAADTVLPANVSPSASDAKITVPDLNDAVMAQFDISINPEVALTAIPDSLTTTPALAATPPSAASAEVQQSHFRIAIYTPGSAVPQVLTDTSPQISNSGLPGYAPLRYWGRYELRNGYITSVGGYYYTGGNYGYSGNRGYSNYGYGGNGSGTSVYIVTGSSSYRGAPGVRAPVSTWYLHN